MTRTSIEFASESMKNETLALDAIEQFYMALNRMFLGDLSQMEAIWSQGQDPILMGPFGGRQIGRGEIIRMFRRDAETKSSGMVTPRDVMIKVSKELAYSVCLERGEITTKDGTSVYVDLRGTNILKREGDAWRLVYHHTDPLPQMQQASNLKADDFFTPRGQTPNPDVLKALDALYDGVRKMFGGDLVTIAGSWGKADDVTFASPTGNILVGWPAIRSEYERASTQNFRGDLQYKDPLIHIEGDLAYASVLSNAPDMTVNGRRFPLSQRTTVVFHREGMQWRVVHHHIDLAYGLTDVMKK